MPEELTRETRLKLITNAISGIERCIADWRRAESDPGSSSEHRASCKRRIETLEHEFGWQWRNVKAILEEENDGK